MALNYDAEQRKQELIAQGVPADQAEMEAYGGSQDESYLPGVGDEPQTPPAQSQPPRYRYPRQTPIQATGGPNTTSGTPQQQAQQDRITGQHAGNAIEQDTVDYTNSQIGRGEGYEDRLNESYDPLLAGNGGYNPQEAADIQNAGDLDPLTLTQGDIDGQQLTPDEQAAIMGDPERAMAYINPETRRSVQMEGEKRRSEAAGSMERNLNAAVDPAKLGVSEGFADDLAASNDRSKLGVRGDFASDLTGAVDTTEGRVDDYLNPESLNVSQDFLDDYQMSDADKQGIVTSAAMDVRSGRQAAIDDLGRRARAEGTNAVGAAALQDRMRRTGEGAAGDAMTRARVAAEEAQANRLSKGEDMRLRYGQNLAGMQTDAALQTGQQRGRALETAENTRLNSERDMANRGLDITTTAENTRLGAERDISNRGMQVATTAGNANMDVADRNSVTAVQNEKDLSNESVRAQQGADDRRTERSGAVATNRQNVQRTGQQARFNQTQQARTTQSGQAQTVADRRLGDQQTARNHLATQQAQANQNVQQGQQNRLVNNATTQNTKANATQNANTAAGTPGKGERMLGGIIGGATSLGAAAMGGGRAKGGVITKPTYMLVGEDGPEIIAPLTGEDPEVLPGIAMQYGEDAFATTPPPNRRAPAYGKQLRYAG
jgi:hypothetical protein